MSDQQRPTAQPPHESSPTVTQAIRFLTATAMGAAFLFLSGITLTGSLIFLILATPVLILFSPVLVPAGIVMFLVMAGFLFSGGCGVAAVTALSWVYSYVAGKHPPGSDRMDYVRMRIADKARDMKERATAQGA
ncbi:oleosin family protein [Actinidia rufa]|uniref:Oleosin family protein n=1 Tax=Actinidia rufa TaxID=165716 RepID=A0A7J0GCI4_9ERIC|nr:oleosin family protein [Actinidia rufa]